jgi:CBS domain-containing protein
LIPIFRASSPLHRARYRTVQSQASKAVSVAAHPDLVRYGVERSDDGQAMRNAVRFFDPGQGRLRGDEVSSLESVNRSAVVDAAKEASMQVRDAMTNEIVSVSPATSVSTALDTMIRAHLSGLPVIDDDGALVGVVSEADFLRRVELGTESPHRRWFGALFTPGRAAGLYARTHARRVREIMSTDVVSVEETASLEDAATLMEKRRVKRLPVIRAGKVVGMITRADFVRMLAPILRESYDEPIVADREIKDRIHAEMKAQLWAPIATVDVVVNNGAVTLYGAVTDERERKALNALVENIEGVRVVHDHMVWIDPNSGTTAPSPEDSHRDAPA